MCGKMVHELYGLYLQTNSYIWMSSVVYVYQMDKLISSDELGILYHQI